MNVITICQLDSWIETHLRRFLYFAKEAMPCAKIYLLVPLLGNESDDAIAALKERLAPYIEEVRFVPKPNIPGRLLDFDLLKASSLDLFNLDEGLFVDVDIDILEDLSSLPSQSDADLLWTADPFKSINIEEGLKTYGFEATRPYMQLGMFYMRKSFAHAFERVLLSGKIDFNGYVPGSVIWNIILREEKSTFLLPPETHVTVWATDQLFSSKAIHFIGTREKEWRFHWRYEGSPRKIIIDPKPMNYPGIQI